MVAVEMLQDAGLEELGVDRLLSRGTPPRNKLPVGLRQRDVACPMRWPKEHRMPFSAYLPTSGASFGPEAIASMTKAFEDTIATIGIDPGDEPNRAMVARFIFHLAEIDGGLDSATLRDNTVTALASQVR
jgi:hypothetical protein